MLFLRGVFIPEIAWALGELVFARPSFSFRLCTRFLVDFSSFNFRCSFFRRCLKYSASDSPFCFFLLWLFCESLDKLSFFFFFCSVLNLVFLALDSIFFGFFSLAGETYVLILLMISDLVLEKGLFLEGVLWRFLRSFSR